MTIELTEERKQQLRADYARGFVAYCGLSAMDISAGRLSARVDIDDRHRQQDGFIHAGVMATLADHTAGYAAFTMIPEGRRILTIEFKINFLRPAFGPALICRSRVLKPGRKVLICESEIFDQRADGDVLAAKAMATMASVHESELRADR